MDKGDTSMKGQILVDVLGLEYSPVAIKLLGKNDEAPLGARRPEKKLVAFCAGIVEAGRGKMLLLQREDSACNNPNLILGLLEEANGINSEGRPPLRDTKSIVLSPISDFEGEPDAVLVWLDPEQAEHFLEAATYELGFDERGSEKIHVYPLCGEMLSCPATLVARVMMDNRPYLAISGRRGNKNLGDKLILGMPYSFFDKASRNILKSEERFPAEDKITERRHRSSS